MTQQLNLLDRFKAHLSLQGKTLLIALRDPRLPLIVRLLLWFAIAYLACPLDIKPDFLPGGFSDDSIITPVLILFGFLSIPTGIWREARRIAKGATCSLVCVALSSTVLSVPSEAASFFPETRILAQKLVVAIPKSSDSALTQSKCVPAQECDPAFSCPDEFNEHEASLSEGEDKHKHLSVPPKELASRSIFRPSTLAIMHSQSVPAAVWASSHGHQLQLYNSGDESDSSSSVSNYRQALVRPPCKKRGGLFYALSRSRFQGFLLRQHSRTGKIANEFSFGSSMASSYGTQSKQWHEYLARKSARVKYPIKYWLLNQALLL